VGSLDVREMREDERVVLSASLLQLETHLHGERARTTCVVSATLRRANGGELAAILRAKARAMDARHAAASNKLAALHAAVRSAMCGVPKAL
jgi:hypothetical protein